LSIQFRIDDTQIIPGQKMHAFMIEKNFSPRLTLHDKGGDYDGVL
jgi:hypothetical protein